MFLHMNISDRIDLISGKETVIFGEQIFLIAFYLCHLNVVLAKLLIILDRPFVQPVQFSTLVIM